jgi:hypothetical protein
MFPALPPVQRKITFMRLRTFTRKIILLLWLQQVITTTVLPQQNNYVFKEPLLILDFGSGKDEKDINEFPLPKYNRVFNKCPIDGNYSFVPNTSDCFNGDWHTFNSDHTANGDDGNMMLVNANETGGVFLITTLNGVKGKTIYQFSASMVNVCRIGGGCSPLPPDIKITLTKITGEKIVSFQTGLLSQTASPHWRVYSGIFTTPENVTSLRLIMEDITLGGCGNDFALDDITLRECIIPVPVAKTPVKLEPKRTKKPAASITKTGEAKVYAKPRPVKKDSAVIINTKTDSSLLTRLPRKEIPPPRQIPDLILTRENPLIKQIETTRGEIVIELFDNGQIDGDTVTVYDNNDLIISRAGLSHKPVSFHIKIDTLHPYHELIMVANNLGSIPPNTSLMVITANNKRYEVFISSSEQKNAKIVIGLKD